jgi:hypothetical protein
MRLEARGEPRYGASKSRAITPSKSPGPRISSPAQPYLAPLYHRTVDESYSMSASLARVSPAQVQTIRFDSEIGGCAAFSWR